MRFSLTFMVKLLDQILKLQSFTFPQFLFPVHGSRCHGYERKSHSNAAVQVKQREPFFLCSAANARHQNEAQEPGTSPNVISTSPQAPFLQPRFGRQLGV